ncbi:hypothetical protein NPIL_244391 [Nephila pilipes]|uniref:Uncharacterized protein n=1 Tax=Nephila pilipes TaxID=299642 RepID=A0A8X6P4K2_NEPPI|nr:hypothetical protein NPIL_244391 [Nephila pilipes]
MVTDILHEIFVVDPIYWEDSIQAEEPMDWECVYSLEPECYIMEWEESPPQVSTLFEPKFSEHSQLVSTLEPSEVSKGYESKEFEPLKKVSPIAASGVREISKMEVSEQVSIVLEASPRVQR